MSLALWHWHIEISSKCTLACPRCVRTEVPDSLVNTELPLDFFKKNFTKSFIKKNVEKITFCGDDGDPIYAHDFIEVVKYFKSVKPVAMVIITNGSYKSIEWWKELASTLDSSDQIHFSIDGYDQDSNEKYRVNSDWNSIMDGVRTIRENSDCYMYWDAIGFKFNEKKIEKMKSMAKELGFDCFQLTKSTKFGKIYPDSYGKKDKLQPNSDLMSSSHRFERESFVLSERILSEPWKETNKKIYDSFKDSDDIILPMCHIGNKGLYINSKGEFYPCCWVANRYGHNDHWLNLGKKFNLHENALKKVISDKFWDLKFTENGYECKTKCDKSRYTEKYATEW